LFFEQQNALESLKITLIYIEDEAEDDEEQELRTAIVSIWRLPNLKSFEMNLGDNIVLPDTFFDELPHNSTIESINLECTIKNARLLNFMDAVKKIHLYSFEHMDLSDLRLDVIEKIANCYDRDITYAPDEVPESREQFETIFDQFLQRKPSWDRLSKFGRLKKICIGHPSWLRHQDEFQLSLAFCKSLVEFTPNLKELKLYNVRDAHEELVAYLAANKPQTLEVIELHATDPSSKRIKLDN